MIEEGSSYRSFEEEATSAGGDRLVLLTTNSVLPGNDDTGTLVVTISLYITDRKHAERSLAAEKELAEDASRSKTESPANISHELRTESAERSGRKEDVSRCITRTAAHE